MQPLGVCVCVPSYCAVPWAGRACWASLCVQRAGGLAPAAPDWAHTAGSGGAASYCCSCTQTTAEWSGSSSPRSGVQAAPPHPVWRRRGCLRRYFHLCFLSGQEATSSPALPPVRPVLLCPCALWCAALRCWGDSAGVGGAAGGCVWVSTTAHCQGLNLCWTRGHVHSPHHYCLRCCHSDSPFYAFCCLEMERENCAWVNASSHVLPPQIPAVARCAISKVNKAVIQLLSAENRAHLFCPKWFEKCCKLRTQESQQNICKGDPWLIK